jgi:hypothetical protein
MKIWDAFKNRILRFEWIRFFEIGADNNHVHFLIQ